MGKCSKCGTTFMPGHFAHNQGEPDATLCWTCYVHLVREVAYTYGPGTKERDAVLYALGVVAEVFGKWDGRGNILNERGNKI